MTPADMALKMMIELREEGNRHIRLYKGGFGDHECLKAAGIVETSTHMLKFLCTQFNPMEVRDILRDLNRIAPQELLK